MTTDYIGPAWLESLLELCSIDVYDRVVRIDLRGPEFDDATGLIVERFSHLRELALQQTSISKTWTDKFQKLHPDCEVTVIFPIELGIGRQQ